MASDIPRRRDVQRQTPIELAIGENIRAIELLGADVRYTEAQTLLQRARDLVGDVYDGVAVSALEQNQQRHSHLHSHDEVHAQAERAFRRAQKVLALIEATVPNAGGFAPSVELYPDGSATFLIPAETWQRMDGPQRGTLCTLIGSERIGTRAEPLRVITIAVCCTLGRPE